MLNTLKLLLPALVPSWRFFETIAPSARIEFTLLKTAHDIPDSWQEFRARPAKLSFGSMLKRLFWNRRWNESLFMVTCAERLMTVPTEHSAQEICNRIKTELARNSVDAGAASYMQFRLAFLYKHEAALQKHILYISKIYRCLGGID